MSGSHRGNWSSTSNSIYASNSNQHQIIQINPINQTGESKNGIHSYDSIIGADPVNRRLVTGYTQLVTDRVDAGWTCHLVTVTFRQLPGPRGAVIQAMKDELDRVYSTFLTRVHRKPRTASPDELPILIGAADLDVYKRQEKTGPLVSCNGGLHFHNLLLVPPGSRLNSPVDEHFRDHEEMYLGERRLITHLDVRPVMEGHERVVDYVFKTILRGRVSYDEGILVLPRARGEITSIRSH
jgi:hypothetical protein